jgi:hypothetical protein
MYITLKSKNIKTIYIHNIKQFIRTMRSVERCAPCQYIIICPWELKSINDGQLRASSMTAERATHRPAANDARVIMQLIY